MPTDLHARALQEEAALRNAATSLRDALGAARTELNRRHDDPQSVGPAGWGTAFGARQHHELAAAALAAIRADESRIRAALAAVTTAADANTYEAELRTLRVADASLRVQLRHADERVVAARAAAGDVAAVVTAAEAELSAAAARTAWAGEHQALGAGLRASLAGPPLSELVAAAGTLQGSQAFTDAGARIDALLPTVLRERAEERDQEAADAHSAAAASHATVQEALDDAARSLHPVLAEVRIATRRFLEAEDALRGYVHGAPAELAVAATLLARVTAHPDLSAAQVAAIAVTANADGVAAASAESDLAAALADLGAAEQALDDALLAALVEDPDRDPETVQAVIDARAALEAGAVQDPVNDARAAYGDAERADLDRWEVEVPATLWDALADLFTARRLLDRLGDSTQRDALVDTLDTAQDALASALDAHDRAVRTGWVAALQEAERRAALAATETTATDRRLQYLRGDGASGRTPAEL